MIDRSKLDMTKIVPPNFEAALDHVLRLIRESVLHYRETDKWDARARGAGPTEFLRFLKDEQVKLALALVCHYRAPAAQATLDIMAVAAANLVAMINATESLKPVFEHAGIPPTGFSIAEREGKAAVCVVENDGETLVLNVMSPFVVTDPGLPGTPAAGTPGTVN
jgi:hypothetical protein